MIECDAMMVVAMSIALMVLWVFVMSDTLGLLIFGFDWGVIGRFVIVIDETVNG